MNNNCDHTGADELQHRHLRGRVLHGDSIRSQTEIASATNDLLLVGIIEMRIEDLLGQSQRPIQPKRISQFTFYGHILNSIDR